MAKLKPIPRDTTGEPFLAKFRNGGKWLRLPWNDPTEPLLDSGGSDEIENTRRLFRARKRFIEAQVIELRKLTQCPEGISDQQFLSAHGFTYSDRNKPQTAHLKLNGRQ